MAKRRKRSGGGRSGGGVVRAFSYLAVAAIGAVGALVATGNVPMPEWPKTLMADVEKAIQPERTARELPERTSKAEPARRPAAKPDRTIETAGIPVPRPQRVIPDKKPAPAAPVLAHVPAAQPPRPAAGVPAAASRKQSAADDTVAKAQPASAPAGGKVTRLSGVAFPVCGEAPSRGCVIDGDTFVLDGKAIRVAGIEVPESGDPECAREADLADRARKRLTQLLSAGPVELVAATEDRDVYGRKQRAVLRDGRPVAETLIAEGLARPAGSRTGWCR